MNKDAKFSEAIKAWAEGNIQEQHRKQFVEIAIREYNRYYGDHDDFKLKVAVLEGGYSNEAIEKYVEARHKGILRRMQQIPQQSL